MIRSVLYLQPRGGDGRAVAEMYEQSGVLEDAAALDGCLGAELQLPIGGEGDVLVTALWRDADAYQGWLDNPQRALNADELAALVEDFDTGISGQTYQLVLDERGPR
jgi:heme-degrading monooxygenase HmoA